MSSPKKFRVWDGEEMHLPSHDYILTSGGVLRQIEWRGDDDRGYEPWRIMPVRRGTEAMHYTGLDDAEGRPIYEEDILKSREYGWQVKVGWFDRNGRFYLWHWGDEYHTEGCNDLRERVIGSSDYIVIGNRYENPELLDEEQDST